MPNIYTRTGDQGSTGLFGGSRVAKQAVPVEAYGTVDEANSAIGYAKQWVGEECAAELHHIQQRLFPLAAELASDALGKSVLGGKIAEGDVEDLERLIDRCLEMAGPTKQFVVPGRDLASASLHQARTIVRRAERRVLAMAETAPVRPELVKYLNRLSDALYAIARVKEHEADLTMIEDVVRRAVGAAGGEPAMPTTDAPLDLATAKALAEAAEAKAQQMGVPIVFAAVDSGGNLILAHRMADSLLASIDIAINKAYTSVALKMPTANLREAAGVNGPLYAIESSNNGRLVLFGGGLPIFAQGKIAGGIGVSGGSVEEDVIIITHAYNQVLSN